jgi:hypothetical protein
MIPSTTEAAAFTALRAVLLDILPSGTEVVRGQVNRVPEVKADDFVVFTPLRRPRISTNVDANKDVRFTGSILGTLLTVEDLSFGTIVVGAAVYGVGVANGTTITSFDTGTGGVGTYEVSVSQTVSRETLSAGGRGITQSTQLDVQLDVHGPASADNAQVISTVLRDAYGSRLFAAHGGLVAPLYADDPRQMPFTNDQQQYEYRWIVEARLQIKPEVRVPTQYADVVEVVPHSVDAEFPP